MLKTICEFVKKCYGLDCEIDCKSNLSTYGIDSLKRVQLVIALEEEYNIEFSADDLTQHNFENVENISKLLERYGKVW